ncbi:hypothetical protein [Brevibacillus invocatus]|uniref:hypothetical protein n=1 Tax=Brevibacillus invocatus TaxID=173959 RepID=UPI00203E515F|nr:hypothetical protein [Brevibacillus invocatus]MCM3079615.1 hypothetical protein [Brevibacillus invocatus]MCM3429813.1 hypothetical protein [Brevibacillus invocatus]
MTKEQYIAILESKMKDLMADLQVVKTDAGREAVNARICQVNETLLKEKGLLADCTCEEHECCPDCSPEE